MTKDIFMIPRLAFHIDFIKYSWIFKNIQIREQVFFLSEIRDAIIKLSNQGVFQFRHAHFGKDIKSLYRNQKMPRQYGNSGFCKE